MRPSALLLTLPSFTALGNARMVRARHQHIAGDVARRFGGTRWTYFAPGVGACGGTNVDTDYIVALNSAQWAGGVYCGKQITMTYGGRTTTATIVDECPGCPYGGLDLSPGLFSFFASTDLGVLSGVWAFEADAPTHAKMTPAAAPTSTSRPHAHSQSHSRFLATVLASAEAAAPSPISILDGDDDDDGAEDGNVFDLVGDGGKLEWCDEGAEDVVEAEGAEGAEDAEDAEQA